MSIKICADILRALFCNREAPHFAKAVSRFLFKEKGDDYQNNIKASNAVIEGGGGSNSIKENDMVNFINKLFAEDFKLLHIIERFSLSDHLVISVSYGRLVTELLDYCY